MSFRLKLHSCCTLLLPVIVSFSSMGANAADYYVDGSGGNDFNSGAYSSPIATVYRAMQMVGPGDTIHIQPTTTYTYPFYVNQSGTASAPITLKGEGTGSNRTKILVQNNFGIQVANNISNISIQNFDVSAPGNYSAIFVSSGASHISITGNVAHDSGGSGINTVGSDYITIVNNTVYNTAWNNSTACGSGISLYQLRNSDYSTAYKNYVMNNLLFSNTNTPGGSCSDSDGSGIIIDDSRNTQGGSPYGAYVGATLIGNNVAVNNGGRGVHIFQSDNVLIANNTMYKNNQDLNGGPPDPGEITLVLSGNIQIFNNILYSDGYVQGYLYHAAITTLNCDGGPILINNNVMYNATNNVANAFYITTSGSHGSSNSIQLAPWGSWNLWADPQFKNPTTSMQSADFEVHSWSPALGIANRVFTPFYDMMGTPVPQWPTSGAYENPSN